MELLTKPQISGIDPDFWLRYPVEPFIGKVAPIWFEFSSFLRLQTAPRLKTRRWLIAGVTALFKNGKVLLPNPHAKMRNFLAKMQDALAMILYHSKQKGCVCLVQLINLVSFLEFGRVQSSCLV